MTKVITDEKRIDEVLRKFPEVKLAYLFGSRARGDASENSDYDLAVYLDSRDVKNNYKTKFSLMSQLGMALRTDKVDVVVIDDTDKPELKYNIIQEGKLLKDAEAYRIIMEPRILNEYFDFYMMLKRNKLTEK